MIPLRPSPIFLFPSRIFPIKSVAVSSNVAASGDSDNSVKIYDLSTSSKIGSFIDHSASVTAFSFYTLPSLSFPATSSPPRMMVPLLSTMSTPSFISIAYMSTRKHQRPLGPSIREVSVDGQDGLVLGDAEFGERKMEFLL